LHPPSATSASSVPEVRAGSRVLLGASGVAQDVWIPPVVPLAVLVLTLAVAQVLGR